MKFSKFCVCWGGLSFFIFGWAYLIFPVFMVNLSGMEIPIGPAVTDTRAMYGGIATCRIIGIMMDPGSLHGAEDYHLWAIFILELPVTACLIIGMMREHKLHGAIF